MKRLPNIKARWKNIIDTVMRFPLTIGLLVLAAIMNSISINTRGQELYSELFISLVLGASVNVVGQLIYERFLKAQLYRFIIMGISVLSTIIYYFAIHNRNWSTEVTIRTTAIFFIILVSFLWVPVIKNRYHFNQSFMAVFKAFFTAVFFTGVLFLGISLILTAIDMLIAKIDPDAYGHTANYIFVILAPIYFLSLIPNYHKNEEYEESTIKLVSPSKFLESLISYIIIPVTVVFTIILILYIVMNITGDFWTDNLMEPLLFSYSLTVIIVYLLSCNIFNAMAKYFRLIFPKVLIPVVLFQTVASVLKINEIGVTYGRYYIILFGIFATIAGIIFSIVPFRKNGIIAPILLLLSLISIIPPVDAFTVSKTNQISRLEAVLKKNDMLKEDKITSNSNITKEDQKTIITSVHYLNSMDYTKNVAWLGNYAKTNDFTDTFGFAEYDVDTNTYQNVYIIRDDTSPVPISGYDYVIYKSISNQNNETAISKFEKNDKNYKLTMNKTTDNNQVIILEQDGQKLVEFNLGEMYNKYANTDGKEPVLTEDVTFTSESTTAVLTVVAQTIGISGWEGGSNQYAEIYILVTIK